MLKIPKDIIDAMVSHACELAPHECCGLLAGEDGLVTRLYRIKNVVALEGAGTATHFDESKVAHLQRLSPEDRAEIAFVMDALEQGSALKDMRTKGLQLQVIYHSHPVSPARPSLTDIQNATEFEEIREKLNLPRPLHLIISLQDRTKPDLRAYTIESHRAIPAEFLSV